MANDSRPSAVSDLIASDEGWLESRAASPTVSISAEARRDLVALLAQRLEAAAAPSLGKPTAWDPRDPPSTDDPRDSSKVPPRDPADVFDRCPELARILGVVSANWRRSVAETLARIARDHTLLGRAFRAKGAVEGWEGAVSDVHDGGRSVAILRFSSNVRVVYKPRDLGISVWFNDLVRWLNDTGLDPPLHVRAILPRDGYGWEQFIAPEPCRSSAEAERFFTRLGMLLRLLQMLDGRDFHRENVIAHGEHPILVDLETLFHPILPVAAPAADDDEILPQSRGLRTGILPIPGNAGLRGRETELTVIGHTADLAWPFTSRGSSTAFEASEGLLAAPCVPVLDGCAVDPLPNRELFVDGYRQMDRTLRRVSRQLLEEGLLDRAADLPVRVVLRDTLTYAKVLTWSLQPDALSDGRSREARLEVLRRGHVGGDRLPAHVFQHEVDSLRDLDIPRFEVLPGEQDAIWRGASAEGDPPESTPLERVRNRLERAAGGSPDEDIKVIRSAFAMLEKRR